MNVNFRYVYQQLLEKNMALCCEEYYEEKPLTCHTYKNAIVLPAKTMPSTLWSMGGVLDCNLQLVKGTGQHNMSEMQYDFDRHDMANNNYDAVYLGHIDSCYGHAITDSLRFVWFFFTQEYQLLRNKVKIVYITPKPLKNWQIELMELAGIDMSNVEIITKATKYKSLIIPESSIYHSRRDKIIWTRQYYDTIERIICNSIKKIKECEITIPKLDNVYFSRGGWGSLDYGDGEIEKSLKKTGIGIVVPQNYSVAEQVCMVNNAKQFISTDGSIAHNALFCNKDCELVILRKTLHINPYSNFIINMKGVRTTFIDCSLSVIVNKNNYNSGPYFVYPNQNFCDFFSIPQVQFPWKEFRKYKRNIWRYSDKPERLQSCETYSKLLSFEIERTLAGIDRCLDKLLSFLPERFKKKAKRKLRRIILYKKIA